MRALVISGGGSKGAFAGGIAQYLLEEEKQSYDLFLGTSTWKLAHFSPSSGKSRNHKRSIYPSQSIQHL
jgi:predicted patatin/cPLA2 family phospholipase